MFVSVANLGILGNALVIQNIVYISIAILWYFDAHIFNSLVLLYIIMVRVDANIIYIIIVMYMIMMIHVIEMVAVHFDVIGTRDQCDSHRVEGLLEAQLRVETARCIIFGTNNNEWCVTTFDYFFCERLGQMDAESGVVMSFRWPGNAEHVQRKNPVNYLYININIKGSVGGLKIEQRKKFSAAEHAKFSGEIVLIRLNSWEGI